MANHKNKIFNYRTKTFMTKKEAWSCCCEDFMPEQHGVSEPRLIELNELGLTQQKIRVKSNCWDKLV